MIQISWETCWQVVAAFVCSKKFDYKISLLHYLVCSSLEPRCYVGKIGERMRMKVRENKMEWAHEFIILDLDTVASLNIDFALDRIPFPCSWVFWGLSGILPEIRASLSDPAPFCQCHQFENCCSSGMMIYFTHWFLILIHVCPDHIC